MTSPVILWLRQDLRLHDHPALMAAIGEGPVVPVYVLDDQTPGNRRMGGAQRWWLHHSLSRLAESFAALGSTLVLRRGRSEDVLRAIAAETGARRIHVTEQLEPWWRAACDALSTSGLEIVAHEGNQLVPPASMLTGSGTRYRVFTPWWKALLLRMPPRRPLRPPAELISPPVMPPSEPLAAWQLLPRSPDWSTGFGVWTPGEEGARAALRNFLPALAGYHAQRNEPSVAGTSRLSPHLHFGEISPATVWHVCAREAGAGAEPFLRELGWRDYATNLIDQIPDYDQRNGRPAYDRFPWRTGPDADADFVAWTKGLTGYPIVDAGMRELWATGWMHNRVRMIAASFLVKHLLIDWRRGEQWFWDTLLDADHGANASNWQWVAGTGVDAPLFSRIMAPLAQSEKFSAAGYIRTWVPELAGLSEPAIHDPDSFGFRPAAYPEKRIGHREARERALAAVRATRGSE
jgi:deoxyribodipyrimidine photo-lyase